MKESLLALERREACRMIRVKGSGLTKAQRGEDTAEVFSNILLEKIGFDMDKKDIISAWRENPRKNNNMIVR